MNLINKTLCLSTKDEIAKLNELLHDALFDLDDACFDKKKGIWKARFSKMGEGDQVKKWLFFKWKDTDIRHYKLKIFGVKNLEIIDRSDIGRYMFEKIMFYGDHQLSLEFIEDLEINVELNNSYSVELNEVAE